MTNYMRPCFGKHIIHCIFLGIFILWISSDIILLVKEQSLNNGSFSNFIKAYSSTLNGAEFSYYQLSYYLDRMFIVRLANQMIYNVFYICLAAVSSIIILKNHHNKPLSFYIAISCSLLSLSAIISSYLFWDILQNNLIINIIHLKSSLKIEITSIISIITNYGQGSSIIQGMFYCLTLFMEFVTIHRLH